MCDSAWPVGTVPITFRLFGSMIEMDLSSSVETYSSPFFGPNCGQCGRTPRPKSRLPTILREARSIATMLVPSLPGFPTPELP